MKSRSSRPIQLLSGPSVAAYQPRLAPAPARMSRVGPAATTHASRSRASSRLAWLSRLTPFSMPMTTDTSAMAVMPAISSTLVVVEAGTPNRWASPAAVCSAPKPSEVANPKSVATTARVSMR